MKILLPVDGSDCTKRTIAYVAAHDEMFGSQHQYVMLLALDASPANVASFTDPLAAADYRERETKRVFGPLHAFAAQNGWRVRFETVDGAPGAAIAQRAEEETPDLVVMGSHGRTALSAAIMGSVTTCVLASCKVPVLVIR